MPSNIITSYLFCSLTFTKQLFSTKMRDEAGGYLSLPFSNYTVLCHMVPPVSAPSQPQPCFSAIPTPRRLRHGFLSRRDASIPAGA